MKYERNPSKSAANRKECEGFRSKVLQIPQNMQGMPSKVLPIARNLKVIYLFQKVASSKESERHVFLWGPLLSTRQKVFKMIILQSRVHTQNLKLGCLIQVTCTYKLE